MGLQEDFQKALRETEIHRSRRPSLLTLGSTELPYFMLSESLVNEGDTVVRRGVVKVEKPQILLLKEPSAEFEGFEYEDDPSGSGAFMALGRITSFPPGKYSNIDSQLDVFEGSLSSALSHYEKILEQKEDVHSGLVSGPIETWAFSLFVYVGNVVMHSAPNDIDDMIRKYMKPPGF